MIICNYHTLIIGCNNFVHLVSFGLKTNDFTLNPITIVENCEISLYRIRGIIELLKSHVINTIRRLS